MWTALLLIVWATLFTALSAAQHRALAGPALLVVGGLALLANQ